MTSNKRDTLTLTVVLSFSLLLFSIAAPAQVNPFGGVPASVTSMGFGGHFDRSPGIPASVTSPGFGRQFQSQLFRRNSNSHRFRDHHAGSFFPGGAVYAVPYPF